MTPPHQLKVCLPAVHGSIDNRFFNIAPFLHLLYGISLKKGNNEPVSCKFGGKMHKTCGNTTSLAIHLKTRHDFAYLLFDLLKWSIYRYIDILLDNNQYCFKISTRYLSICFFFSCPSLVIGRRRSTSGQRTVEEEDRNNHVIVKYSISCEAETRKKI